MKNNRRHLLIWSILTALLLTALVSIVSAGPKYIGKSFVESDRFKSEMDYFYERLGQNVLNPIDLKKEKAKIVVSKDEIEEHRLRYGTLAEQIANIGGQYEGKIAEAKAADNELLETELIKERDAKIEDIRQNFEDDKHVEAKIRVEKERALEQYIYELVDIDTMHDYNRLRVAYKLKDVETGEIFTSGDVKAPASHKSYKKIFNLREGYLKANSLHISGDELDNYMEETLVGSVTEGYTETVTVDTNQVNSNPASIRNPVRNFEGVVVVSEKALLQGEFGHDALWFNRGKYVAYATWIAGVLSLVLLLTKFRFTKSLVIEGVVADWYNRLKIDVKGLLLGITAMTLLIFLMFVGDLSNYIGHLEDLVVYGIMVVMLVAGVLVGTFQLVNFINGLKSEGAFWQGIVDSYTMKFFVALRGVFLKFFAALRDMFIKTSIGVQTFILLIGFFLAGFGFMFVFLVPPALIIYIPAVLFLGLPALYMLVKRSAYLNRIIVATEAMANGRLHKEIDIEGHSPLAEHAKNLNNLREGVRDSMTEQAKSERLKTELITNVSHDLRTPLTSIITYTDLLKNEDLTVEERTKYVDILDKKSQRLKTLIEDLFDVSKMASGNLELTKQRVDMTQLLQQALAEHEEEISKSGLDFRVNFPESALVAYVDGKRWWRVLDNLIVNAIKYTLPGTRVYITLRKVGDTAEFVVKNVTKYELGENTDELFERFKRADTSRHTDGSGLGLAIAQSIVDLHNGNMKIEVDGDLFKVTVVVAAV